MFFQFSNDGVFYTAAALTTYHWDTAYMCIRIKKRVSLHGSPSNGREMRKSMRKIFPSGVPQVWYMMVNSGLSQNQSQSNCKAHCVSGPSLNNWKHEHPVTVTTHSLSSLAHQLNSGWSKSRTKTTPHNGKATSSKKLLVTRSLLLGGGHRE